MKRVCWLLSLLTVLALICAPGLAQQAGEQPKVKKEKPATQPAGVLRGEQAMMVSECQLTEEQKAKLEEAVKAHQTALEAWKKEHGQEMKDAEQAAKEKNDEAAMKAAKEKMAALRADMTKLEKDRNETIQAILTPEQKEKWAAFQLNRTVLSVMGRAKVELTEDQKAKIKEMCAKTCKDVAAMPAEQEKEKKQAVADLHKAIAEQVLTAEQKAQLEKKPERTTKTKPAEEPKAAPAKAAP